MALTASFSGDLKVTQDQTSSATGSLLLKFSLRDQNKAPALDDSQQRACIESPSAFVALPISPNILGRFFAMQMDNSTKFLVRVTYVTTGQVTSPVLGMFITEADAGDEITGVDIQGSGTLSWAMTGTKA